MMLQQRNSHTNTHLKRNPFIRIEDYLETISLKVWIGLFNLGTRKET